MKRILLIVILLFALTPNMTFAETTDTKGEDTKVSVEQEDSNEDEGLDIPYGVGLLILGIIIFNNNRQMNI